MSVGHCFLRAEDNAGEYLPGPGMFLGSLGPGLGPQMSPEHECAFVKVSVCVCVCVCVCLLRE